MMFTIDASVHINALNSAEGGSAESRAFLRIIEERVLPVYSPMLLLVEVSASISRLLGNPALGLRFAEKIRFLPAQTLVPLDHLLLDEACRLGAEQRLRGADAVYAAVAQHYGSILVTTNRQQLDRLSPIMQVKRPAEILQDYP